MLRGWSIEHPPRDEPDKTDCACDDERRAPSPLDRDYRHDERRDESADVCPRVENAGSERAFFFGKPLGHSLNCRRKVSCFTQAKQEASNTEPEHRVSQSMAHRREAP